jgi:hypothetical protein
MSLLVMTRSHFHRRSTMQAHLREFWSLFQAFKTPSFGFFRLQVLNIQVLSRHALLVAFTFKCYFELNNFESILTAGQEQGSPMRALQRHKKGTDTQFRTQSGA